MNHQMVMQMKKKQQKKYESYRNTLFDKNYEKTLKQVYKELNWEYKRVLREIEDELLKWESKRASGAMPNTFGYSEEQHLRESKKAIELLINELAENEYKLLDRAMSKLYAQDLLDMNKLEIEYLKYRDLQALRRTEYITKPKILIMDTDLRNQWGRELGDVYKYFDGIEYPEEYFDRSNDEFEELIKNAPHWLTDIIKVTAMAMIRAENYPDVKKIRIIDDTLGTCIKDFL